MKFVFRSSSFLKPSTQSTSFWNVSHDKKIIFAPIKVKFEEGLHVPIKNKQLNFTTFLKFEIYSEN